MTETADNSIRLPSHLTIRQAAEVYRQCEDALKGTASLRVNASEVSKVDTAGLQLLVALKTEMDQQRSAIEWISITDELRRAAQFMGLQHLFDPSPFG
jgi:ABC-type transporter Mla MlaB component